MSNLMSCVVSRWQRHNLIWSCSRKDGSVLSPSSITAAVWCFLVCVGMDASLPEQSQTCGNAVGTEEQGLHLVFCGVSKTQCPARALLWWNLGSEREVSSVTYHTGKCMVPASLSLLLRWCWTHGGAVNWDVSKQMILISSTKYTPVAVLGYSKIFGRVWIKSVFIGTYCTTHIILAVTI